MNAGVYFFKKKFLDFIKNKKEFLENDILPKLILNNNIKDIILQENLLI